MSHIRDRLNQYADKYSDATNTPECMSKLFRK